MPLPNPDYLTAESYNWNGTTSNAVRITTDAAAGGSKRNIRWDALDAYDRRTIHDMIMGYNARLAIPETETNAVANFAAGSAYHTMDFNGRVVGGNATGLLDNTDYTFSVDLNGAVTSYSVNGSFCSTFTDLVAQVEAALPGTMLAEIFDGNIEISSVATGAGEVIKVVNDNLFNKVAGFVGYAEIRVGVTTVADVFDLNKRDDYQTYAELLTGKLRTITNKTPRSAKDTTDVYFNHGTGTWLLLYTDVAPV